MPTSTESHREADLRLRAAVEFAPSGLVMVDGTGHIVLVNREVERLFGYAREEILGQPVELLLPERFRQGHMALRDAFLGAPRMRAMGVGRELYGQRKDGSEFPVEIGLTPMATEEGLFVLAAVVDISERKWAEQERRRLEEQLRQGQKMEAIGTLAGGVAHDFNNVLGAIIGFAELAREEATSAIVRTDLDDLLRAADRGRELVERILRFSRRQEATRRPVDLGEAVAEASQILRATLPATIDVRLDLDVPVPPVLADVTSVHQVLMNLATNAAHAMPDGGTLEIGLESVYVHDSLARTLELREGRYTVLRVRDSGTGIEPEIRHRIFEPFFTTKGSDAGTGLGLTMVSRIVADYQGGVQLESEVGKGTLVRCFFPSLDAPEHNPMPGVSTTPRGHGERLLFVDDEPALVRVGQRRLEVLGYRVEGLTDSTEALSLVSADPSAFDLIVTDFSMPRLTGLELAAAVHALRPELPVVLLSGYVEGLTPEKAGSAGIREVVRKPVTAEGLATALHRILAPEREAPAEPATEKAREPDPQDPQPEV